MAKISRDKRKALQTPQQRALKNKKCQEKSIERYGITEQDYQVLLAKQNGVCAICVNVCASGRRLAVDHCHTTLAVRGLLCTKCNRGVGLFADSAARLRAAADYLDEANGHG